MEFHTTVDYKVNDHHTFYSLKMVYATIYIISNPITVFTLQHVLGREHTHTPLQYSLRPLFSHTQESIRIGKPQDYLPRNQKVLG